MLIVLCLIIVLLVVLLGLFLLVDWYLKRDNKNKATKTATKNEVTKPITTAAKTEPATAVAQPAMTIYNSNLADDLSTMLETGHAEPTDRKHTGLNANQSKIAKYIAEKNYHTFAFDADPNTETIPMSLTAEDYKKFVAISNIDDKK